MKTADVRKRAKYSGYRSFQYLEAGSDYREFVLAKELDRVPSRRVEVSDRQEERVQNLLDENLVISLHDHCFVVPENVSELAEYRRQGRDFTGYAGMAESGLDAVFDCLMDGTGRHRLRLGDAPLGHCPSGLHRAWRDARRRPAGQGEGADRFHRIARGRDADRE